MTLQEPGFEVRHPSTHRDSSAVPFRSGPS
jgi:hypothetical protein